MASEWKLTKVTSFSEIEPEFIERVHRMVWCSMATLDTTNRLRSRLMHPIWEGATGWIGTRRHSLKARHLAHHPFVSPAYIADVYKPVYADCLAEWDDDLASKERIWELFCTAPLPLGYDPAPIFHSADHPDFGLLKLTPFRISMMDLNGEARLWQRRDICTAQRS